MSKPIRILYIDDSPFDRELVQDALEKENAGFELVITASHASFEAALAQGGFDIVLSDFNILGFDGLQVLEVVHAQDVNLPVIIVTGTGSEEIAVEALKRGASEYVIKTPAHIQRLPQTIHAVLGKKRLAEERKQAEEALRASEKMLHEAQIIAGLGSYSLDIATGLWTSSDVLDDIFGIDATYVRSVDGWAALIHPDDRQRMMDYFTIYVLGQRGRFDQEYRIIRHADKAERWVHGLGELEIDAQNHVLRLYGTIQDITARKRTEEALRKAEEKYRNIFENSVEAITQTTPEGRYITANPATARILGYDSLEELMSSINDLNTQFYVEPGRREEFKKLMEKQGSVVGFESEVYRKDGSRVWVSENMATVRDEHGILLYYEGTSEDITERKQAEAVLAYQSSLLENVSDAIISTDPDFTIRTWNYAAETLYGWKAAEVIGKLFPQVIPTEYPNNGRYQVLEEFRTNGFWKGEVIQKRRDGARLNILSAASFVHDSAGNPTGTVVVNRDITDYKRVEQALHKSEDELRALFASMQDAVLVIDRDGVYRNVAPTNPAFWYIPPQELLGKKLHEIFPAEQSAMFYRAIQQVLDTQQTMQIEYELTVGSQPVWYAASISPMDRESTLWVARDITERKQAEEAQHQRFVELEALHTISIALRTAQTQQDALPLLLDHTLAALNTDAGTIWLYDWETDELHVAVERGWFQRLNGFPIKPGEGIGGMVYSTGKPYLSREFLRDPQSRITTQGQAPPGWGGVCLPIRMGETTVGVIFISLPPPRQITPEQVKLLESLAEMAGVTLYRLRLLEEAQEQARRIQVIMDTTPMGILLLQADGRILLANPVAAADLSLLTSQDTNTHITHLGNRPLAELLNPPPTEGGWHTVQAGMRTFEITARPVSDTPAARLWVLVLNDVTQAREQQRYQQAQERLATVGQLAAGIAHDFNNIMGVIVLHVGMLHNASGLTERQQRQLDTINEQAKHAANLIRQILDFSRRSVLEKTALDLLPLVKEMVRLLERTLPESIRLELTYDRSEYIVNGDPTRLQQALMNLAFNARDAMPNGGQLTFTCTSFSLASGQTPPLPDMAAGDWFCLSVADTGTGITPQHLTHIFEPFFTTKEPGKGSGLGLAQVYGIIKQHGGAIDVQTQEGKGTTFVLYLPALAGPTLAMPAPRLGFTQGQGETILVVEDNEIMRTALVEMLEFLNYRVQEAANGHEALAILEEKLGAIDLVLSDLVMPEMGGQYLLQAMRARGLHLPFVVLSGHPLTNEMQPIQAQGLAGWLLKPPDMAELTALFAHILGQRAG